MIGRFNLPLGNVVRDSRTRLGRDVAPTVFLTAGHCTAFHTQGSIT